MFAQSIVLVIFQEATQPHGLVPSRGAPGYYHVLGLRVSSHKIRGSILKADFAKPAACFFLIDSQLSVHLPAHELQSFLHRYKESTYLEAIVLFLFP